MASENDIVSKLIKKLPIAQNRNEILDLLREIKNLSDQLCRSNNSGLFFPLGEALLNNSTSLFLGQLTKREFDDLFLGTFLVAPPTDVLLLLQKTLNAQHEGCSVDKCIQITIVFVKNRIKSLFVLMCNQIVSESTESLHNSLCQAFVSLPTNVANILKGKIPNELLVENFCRTVALAFVEALETSHRLLIEKIDCSLKFHSNLMGKIQMCGYSKHILRIVIPFLNSKCQTDFVWTRIAQRFIVGVPRNSVESLICDVILLSNGRIRLHKLLGDSIVKDEKIRFVLTKKLLFMRYFDDATILLTIFDCLSETANGRPILKEVFLDLLQVWSSESSTTQSSFQHHFYQSQAIVVAVTQMTDNEKCDIKGSVTSLMLQGMQNHLNSPREQIRRVGMVLGEILTKVFETNGAELKFEYVDDEQTLSLKRLADGKCSEFDDRLPLEFDLETLNMPCLNENVNESQGNSSNIVFDSDDDLEPYEMPDETHTFTDTTGKIKAPVYLLDCYNIILSNKDMQHFEPAFIALEKLIRQDSPGLSDLSVDIVRILLHLEDRYSTENFADVRLRCMVAACVKRPTGVANFLTREFYAKNYCLQHRMDILDVLCLSAKELSDPAVARLAAESGNVSPSRSAMVKTIVPPWRDLVQKRINEKTRRFSTQKSSSTNKIQPVANRFSPVCAQFFYPLLSNFDRPADSTLDLLKRDYIVLVRFLSTIGSILMCSENCPDSINMASCMIEFVWPFRSHSEPFVRQGVLFCLTSAIITVPPRILAAHFQDALIEVRFWLDNECSKDNDTQCKDLANRALNILHKQMQDGLNSMIEISTD